MKIYCEKNGKILDDLTEDDEDIIWDCAGNHIAFFIYKSEKAIFSNARVSVNIGFY